MESSSPIFPTLIHRRMYHVSYFSTESNFVALVDLSRISKCQLLFCHHAGLCYSTGTFEDIITLIVSLSRFYKLIQQIFLLTDVLFAQAKYDYHLVNGMDLKINGKEGTLVLE